MSRFVELYKNNQPLTVGEKTAKLLTEDLMGWKLTPTQKFKLTNSLMDSPARCQFYLGMTARQRKDWAFMSLDIDNPPDSDEETASFD